MHKKKKKIIIINIYKNGKHLFITFGIMDQ